MFAKLMRVLPAGIVILSLAYAIAESADLTTTGKIDAATVYTDRASVARVVEIEASQGMNVLNVTNIPAAADESSVRVSAKGTAPITIHNVRLVDVQTAEAADKRVAELQEQLLRTEYEQQLVELKAQAGENQLSFVRKIVNDAGEENNPGQPLRIPPVEELARLMDFVAGSTMSAGNTTLAARMEATKIKKEIDRLNREIADVKGNSAKKLKTISVDYTMQSNGKASFIVEYMTPGAGWAPLYTVRADEGGKTRVSYTAEIHQKTGEDWADAKIVLSTARPQTGAKAPEVEPWRVEGREMYQRMMAGAVPPAPQTLAAPAPLQEQAAKKPMPRMSNMKEEPEIKDATVATTTAASAGTAVVFNIPSRTTIPSGSEKAKVTIAELDFKSENTYFTAPRLSPFVYLRAKVVNTSEYPLLAGPIQVFLGDNYVGRGSIKAIAPEQEVEFDLGVDEGFKVERKLIKKESGRGGVISSKNSVHYIYETKLSNFKKSVKTVEMKDALPYPGNEAIVVKDIQLDPKMEKRDERNILTWKLPLNPREEKKIRMEFTVEYPDDMAITNLGD